MGEEKNSFFSRKDWIEFLSIKQQEINARDRATERKNWSCLIALGALLLLLGSVLREFTFKPNSLEAILYGQLLIFYFFLPLYYFLSVHLQVPRITRRFRIRDVDDMKCLFSVLLAPLCSFLLFNGYLLFSLPSANLIILVISFIFLTIFLTTNIFFRLWPEKTVFLISYAQRKKPYRNVLAFFNLGLELSTVTILFFLLMDYVAVFRANIFDHLFLSGIIFATIAVFVLSIIYFKLSFTFEDLEELQFEILSGKLQRHSEILSEYEEQRLGKNIIRYIEEQVKSANTVSDQISLLLERSKKELQHAKTCSKLTDKTKNTVREKLGTVKKLRRKIPKIRGETNFYVNFMDFEPDERALLSEKLQAIFKIEGKIEVESAKFNKFLRTLPRNLILSDFYIQK